MPHSFFHLSLQHSVPFPCLHLVNLPVSLFHYLSLTVHYFITYSITLTCHHPPLSAQLCDYPNSNVHPLFCFSYLIIPHCSHPLNLLALFLVFLVANSPLTPPTLEPPPYGTLQRVFFITFGRTCLNIWEFMQIYGWKMSTHFLARYGKNCDSLQYFSFVMNLQNNKEWFVIWTKLSLFPGDYIKQQISTWARLLCSTCTDWTFILYFTVHIFHHISSPTCSLCKSEKWVFPPLCLANETQTVLYFWTETDRYNVLHIWWSCRCCVSPSRPPLNLQPAREDWYSAPCSSRGQKSWSSRHFRACPSTYCTDWQMVYHGSH